MKKHSSYFWKCMALAIASLVCTVIGFEFNSPTLSAIMFTIGFIFWFAGIMAPDHEKYSKGNRH